MAARTNEGYQTPIPRRDIESKSNGSGPVITYQLSSEELERYRAMPKPSNRDQNGVRQRKPIPKFTELSSVEEPSKTNQKEEESVLTQSNEQSADRFVPSKVDFLKLIEEGKAISKIERMWKMNAGSLHYWVGKWGYKGIKPDRARELLDEMAIEDDASKEIRGLIAINEQLNQKEPLTSSTDQEAPTQKVVETGSTPDTNDLKYRLERAIERIDSLTETVNVTLDANTKLTQERDDYKSAALSLEGKIDEYSSLALERGNALIAAEQTIEELESDRQVLLATIEEASKVEEKAPAPKRAGRSLHTELEAPTDQIVDELAALISYLRSGNGVAFYLDLQLVEVSG